MSDRRLLCVLLSLTLFSLLQGDTEGAFEPCPGQYCGRIIDDDGKTGDCGACPRGFNTNGTACLECSSSPDLYDWLYLGFMAFLSLITHWFFIDLFAKRDRKSIFFLCLSAFVESTSAAIFSLLASKPQGSLSLTSCKTKQIADWYTIFFNPKPDYVNTIHCTQEAVYPLYTIVLMYYALSVGLLFLFRPIISHQFCDGQGRNSTYAAMYFLPCLAVVHALFGGLIYYSYPYITLTISVLSTAAVLAKNKITHIGQLVKSKRHTIIIMAHWLAHAYGILAVTQLRDPSVHGPMFALVLAPVSFFLLTHSFTEPSKFKTP
ncbi:JNK1/MAPK8-associated membrane protein-like [Stylophora pistillata]|uniref:JNK1/MAPK8-associated membrane protein n=1 Tax=Stylophora pistillata TaxID=50429 RepID=A0A2B4SRW1_STYPI|nr:JNK1/MAPK8-associated membrane protein-like [Stylophora pistillata]PFX33404.1 JNK1/MAPK8-associated membrane protein [Stylophora pistillata]